MKLTSGLVLLVLTVLVLALVLPALAVLVLLALVLTAGDTLAAAPGLSHEN